MTKNGSATDLIPKVVLLVALAMIAFAANSLLCRVAFTQTSIDPATFTVVRLVCGALALAPLLLRKRRSGPIGTTSIRKWSGAIALVVYAFGFSIAYQYLSAATGALILFGSVQLSMLIYGLAHGDRPDGLQWLGIILALAGLVALLWPGLEAPTPLGTFGMLVAGLAWAGYTVLGRQSADAVTMTARNFFYAAALGLPLLIVFLENLNFDPAGLMYAAISGALTSGLGYIIWYRALPLISGATAATVQLSVPVLTALGGVLILTEPLTARLFWAGAAIILGIAITTLSAKPVTN